jgi:dipeptidyl aminopeptidase/acylaminoacyl peptidase
LTIERGRQQNYPGSDIIIEETLDPGSNYERHIVSYLSEGLKIYALLTIPNGEKPPGGWPVIVFNHGYISPNQYRTTERYVAYVDSLARNGYIVFRSDYRGHDNSEGEATGGYGSPAYTTDVLNAVTSIKNYPDADPDRIGMWGHSMGGHITLRSMVTTQDIKVGVIWAGVVAPYPDLLTRWRLPNHTHPESSATSPRRWREDLVSEYGSPEENPDFWASISPNTYVADISGPVQLHHSPADTHVPAEFSETLFAQLQDAEQTVEYYAYENDDHNLSQNFSVAMTRSIEFFDRYLKGE